MSVRRTSVLISKGPVQKLMKKAEHGTLRTWFRYRIIWVSAASACLPQVSYMLYNLYQSLSLNSPAGQDSSQDVCSSEIPNHRPKMSDQTPIDAHCHKSELYPENKNPRHAHAKANAHALKPLTAMSQRRIDKQLIVICKDWTPLNLREQGVLIFRTVSNPDVLNPQCCCQPAPLVICCW